MLCDNTVEEFPDTMLEIVKGSQQTYKVKFREKVSRTMGFNLG
jgi:hypothetical protein